MPAGPQRRACDALRMDVPGRRLPAPQPDDREVLTGWLDWQRATVRAKCHGVNDEEARRSLIPTSPNLTIAGIVSHLASVERHWFVHSFLGKPATTDALEWRVPDDSLATLLDRYDAQCEQSRQIAEAHDFDVLETFAPPGLPLVSLRWILGHMIEETARHLGHLDILRELTDGSRGY